MEQSFDLSGGASAVVAPDIKTKRASSATEMDEETFLGAFRLAAQDAEEYIDGHIAPLRAVATRFYRGEPLGNEEPGRSQIVMTELRDSVLGTIPSLMRIFTSSESLVEFAPTNAATVDLADQQTQYVNHVFFYDNPGFLSLLAALKDGLIRKTGVFKWRWSTDQTVTETQFTGLFAEQVVPLQEDNTVEILEIVQGEPVKIEQPAPPAASMSDQAPQPPAPPQMQEVPTFDVRIRRRIPKNRCIIEVLPPEEYLIARDARSEDDASFQAHRSYKTVSELVAMGFDQEEIEENMGGGDTFQLNYEAQARNPAVLTFMGGQDTPDPAMRTVLYTEAYMRIDKDGDGFAELRKICAIGDSYHVLSDEVVDEAPFAIFCPDPEPHMVIGQSMADQTMDLQLIKTNMVRALLDSLAGSIHPRTVVVEGQVNLDDAMNTEQGAIVRTKQIAAVQELVKPFVGQQALPVIGYVDQIKAKRTGVSDASQGLDPDVLQSTEQQAVQATIQGAQERIDLIARIFAETTMKRLFRGVAKCLRENQDQPRVIKLRGKWVEISPKSWEGDLEAHPNVALGRGTEQEKITFLGLVLQKQEQIMAQLGPTNPLAGIDRYRATLGQLMGLAGYKDASRYFGEITPEYIAQLKDSASKQPPSPEVMLVQVEAQKARWEFELKVAEFQQKQLEAQQKEQFEREKLLMDTLVKLTQIESQNGREVNAGMLERLLAHEATITQQQLAHTQAIHGNLSRLASDMNSQSLKAQVDRSNAVLNAETARAAAQQPNAPAQ